MGSDAEGQSALLPWAGVWHRQPLMILTALNMPLNVILTTLAFQTHSLPPSVLFKFFSELSALLNSSTQSVSGWALTLRWVTPRSICRRCRLEVVGGAAGGRLR